MARWPYNTQAWQALRRQQLTAEPFCRLCVPLNIYEPATVVDHIIPVRDAPDRALDITNLQSLCKPCHDRHKQAQEKGSGLRGATHAGMPMDPAHHWNS